jgi:hypothetical protein
VARTHLAITVELVHGVHNGDLWPRPGRVLIAARTATFEQLGKAIDDAFARWDHNHLHEFTLADGTVIIPACWWDGEEPRRSVNGAKARLRRCQATPLEHPARSPLAPGTARCTMSTRTASTGGKTLSASRSKTCSTRATASTISSVC